MLRSPWMLWGALLGVSLGGFFDGILLHQILQWHHLLSALGGDLRFQVLWDGYFHALMYAVAAVALWGLWRARAAAGDRPGIRLLGALLIGFGLWHVLDAALSHWLLGIHRIRPASESPLAWDLGWLAAFGLVPLALGWLAARSRGGHGGGRRAATLAALLACGGAIGAGAMAMRPPADDRFTAVVFAGGMTEQAMVAALAASDSRIVWLDPARKAAVAQIAPERRLGLYGRGAILVGGAGLPAGCFAWSRA